MVRQFSTFYKYVAYLDTFIEAYKRRELILLIQSFSTQEDTKMEYNDIQSDSSSWLFFVKASFVIALIAMGAGILFMPGGLMVQGYFALSGLFLVSSTITLSKTLRDEHEAQRLIHKISEAKTNKIIREFSE